MTGVLGFAYDAALQVEFVDFVDLTYCFPAVGRQLLTIKIQKVTAKQTWQFPKEKCQSLAAANGAATIP